MEPRPARGDRGDPDPPDASPSPDQPASRGRLAQWRFGARAVLAITAVVLLAAPLGLLLLLLRERDGWVRRTDLDVAVDLNGYANEHPLYTDALRAISFIGSAPIWIAVLGAVTLWLLHRRLRKLAAFVVVTGIGGAVVNALIKEAIGRSRPRLSDPVAIAHGESFPSGHTQSAVVGCGILLLVFLPAIKRSWRVAAFSFAAVFIGLVGFSRIGLGVHYVSDVVGGVIVGTAWLLLMTASFSIWRQDLGQPPTDISRGLEPEHSDDLA